ncbi:MAG: glycoside hydrolase domain-containing protein, partial [Gemmatimonadaceae bacterium]
VTTGDPSILATTWIKPGSAMIALGSWRDDDAVVQLNIDWKALGLDPTHSRIRAPAIDAFQSAATWTPGASITVPGKKGLLLIVEGR